MKTVAVIGSGTMGSGIAQVSALAGYEVFLYDVANDILERAIAQIHKSIEQGVAKGKTPAGAAHQAKEGLRPATSFSDIAPADLIIEAAPEILQLKREIFATLDDLAPSTTIFASNTSSLSINALAGSTSRPDRFLGLHFFNPAHLMKLVEIIPTDDTSPESLATVQQYITQLGKEPVYSKDTPAFIVNRVARPFYGEAFRLLGENATDAPTIDRLLRSVGFRMGPFELVDLIGCDVNFAVTQSVYNAYFQDPKYRPHPLQQRMVESGRLGRKTGRGFYNYAD